MQIGSEVFDQSLEDGTTIARVVDGEVRVVPQTFRLAAQDCHAGRVESLEPNAVGLATQQIANAMTHFGGRLVGEGNGKNLRGPSLFHAE